MAEENGTPPLVKRFVEDCKECFQNVKAHMFQHSDLSKEDAHEVVETLFFRLLFLRFLEEKEWLTFSGNSNYLYALYDSGGIDSKSVYSSRLSPLFSKGLSMEGSQKDDAYGSVPFLNLNLFHETSLDVLEWDVPDTLLQFLLRRNGLFYNYDFN